MATVHEPFINASVNVPRQWRNARGYVNTEYAQTSIAASRLVESTLKEQIRLSGRIATFKLYNNTAIQLIRANQVNAWYTRRIGFKGAAAKYAVFADRGRPPGKMPFSAWLYEWLDAVGLSRKLAYVIARAIGDEGVEGAFFMRATRRVALPRVKTMFDEATARLVEKLKGR